MIDAKDLAIAGIDAAFQGGLARLFDVYHRRDTSNAADALERFTSGYDALLSDYQAARAVVDPPAAA